MMTANEALTRLKEGNRRFVTELSGQSEVNSQARRNSLLTGQHPFAIILGCSDSRAPAEILFDQGLGDLFVIRVAGNIVAPSQVGSIEFAAEHFGTRLVVVLGHSHCGAVKATIDSLSSPEKQPSRNLCSIVNRIRPAVETLTETPLKNDPEALLKHAIRANIRASSNHLRNGSTILEQLIATDKLLIVGAEYSLETGEVDFFDNVDLVSE